MPQCARKKDRSGGGTKQFRGDVLEGRFPSAWGRVNEGQKRVQRRMAEAAANRFESGPGKVDGMWERRWGPAVKTEIA